MIPRIQVLDDMLIRIVPQSANASDGDHADLGLELVIDESDEKRL